MDAIVIGAGVNGLVAASLLSRAGRRVALIDGATEVGGRARLMASTRGVLPRVAAELNLALEASLPLERADGTPVDALPGVAAWHAQVKRWRPLVTSLVERPPPRVGASAGEEGPLALLRATLAWHRLRDADVGGLIRTASVSAARWLAESVEDAEVRSVLALEGPDPEMDTPGTAAPLLARAAMGTHRLAGGLEALTAACAAELWLGTSVARVRLERGRVAGVVLTDGTDLDAPVVISTVHASLLDPLERPPPRLGARWRARGAVAVARARVGGPSRHRRIVAPAQLARALDDARRGRLTEAPPIDVSVEGGIATALVYGAPYHADWSVDTRARLADRVGEMIGAEGPVELSAPPDLEARFGAPGGHLAHGELALDQLWIGRRPDARVPGLLHASDAVHPGGIALGGPGWLAARAVLEATP